MLMDIVICGSKQKQQRPKELWKLISMTLMGYNDHMRCHGISVDSSQIMLQSLIMSRSSSAGGKLYSRDRVLPTKETCRIAAILQNCLVADRVLVYMCLWGTLYTNSYHTR